MECAACVCFFENYGFGKNPLKIYKIMRNEEPTVRPCEEQKAAKPCDTQ